jgi:hypothetical protein
VADAVFAANDTSTGTSLIWLFLQLKAKTNKKIIAVAICPIDIGLFIFVHQNPPGTAPLYFPQLKYSSD